MFYNYVQRKHELEFLLKHQNEPLIKIITGLRRSGKTTLLSQYMAILDQRGIEQEQIISVDFEDYLSFDLMNPQKLYHYILERLQPSRMTYIFLDEVQSVTNFERILDALYYQENIDLYVTGSNQHILKGEAHPLLSDKYIELNILPLSFREYIDWHKENKQYFSENELFEHYTKSSLPFSVFLNSDKERLDYSQGVYSTLLLNEIVKRLNVKDIQILEKLIEVLFHSIGELLTVNKLKTKMTKLKTPIAYNTIDRYINGILDSGLMYRARRYDIQSMQVLRTQEKYYAADIGFQFHLFTDKTLNKNQIIENIIYLELIRRGYEVYVGKSNQFKVTFVTIDDESELSYFQFTPSTSDKQRLDQDLNALKSIRDYYPKYLLTMDDCSQPVNYGGIRRVNVLDWLLDENKWRTKY